MTVRRNMSEAYDSNPRVTSRHTRIVFDNLVEMSEHLDFNHPYLKNKGYRNRSLGSTVSLIVDTALKNQEVLNELKNYMVFNGKDWFPIHKYK